MAKSVYTVRGFFKGRPQSYELFSLVRDEIKRLGPVRIEARKTQITFKQEKNFAFVWLPQMYNNKRPATSITLTFDLPRQAKDKRIAESLKLRQGRYVHHVVLERPRDLDSQVKKWLREAYATFGIQGAHASKK